jgi:hypothetical protein
MGRLGVRVAYLLCFSGIIIASFAASPRPRFFDGLWKSQGYGLVLSIDDSALREFEITTATCVTGFKAERQTFRPNRWEATFKSKEGLLYLKRGEGDAHAILHLEDSVPDIQLDRIDAVPDVCNQPTADTAIGNFEVFARTWAENYISFERRHADWDTVVANFRPQVTSQTTPLQLFEIFELMINPFGDLHTYIAAPSLKRSTPTFWRPGTSAFVGGSPGDFADHESWKLFAMMDRAFLNRAPQMFCNKHLQYGHVNDSIGYLRILSFGGFARHNDLRALEMAMDKIFADARLKALVIDMRLSFGGSDELGLAIASRLTDREYLAYSVQARSNPSERDQWTEAEPIMLRPTPRPGFRGPVVELTSSITMSAAETFSQALMGRVPSITRIGENTQGVFCDVMDRHLPNGWTFGLPNAVYRTDNGTAFDVTGIPPNIDVPLFSEGDLAAAKDPGLAKAVQLLTGLLSQNH